MDLTPEQRRRLDAFHRGLGTLVGIWLFVLSFTGSVSLFRDELDHWSQGQGPRAVGTREAASPAGLDAVVRTLSPQLAQARNVAIRFPEHTADLARRDARARGTWEVTASAADAPAVRYRVDAAAGESFGPVAHEAALTYFQLHAYLLVPGKPGRYVVGGFGVLLVASALTGLAMQRHLLRSALRIRWGRRDRLVVADLHRCLGVAGLIFHVAIGATGAYLGLKDVFVAPALLARFDGDLAAGRSAVRSPPLVRADVTVDMPPLEPFVERATREIPGLEPNLVILQEWGDASARMRVLGTIPGQLLPEHEAEQVLFELATGNILEIQDGQRAPWALRVYHALAPIHYGDFFGVWVRWVYFALGLATAALGVTGVVIRRERLAERRVSRGARSADARRSARSAA